MRTFPIYTQQFIILAILVLNCKNTKLWFPTPFNEYSKRSSMFCLTRYSLRFSCIIYLAGRGDLKIDFKSVIFASVRCFRDTHNRLGFSYWIEGVCWGNYGGNYDYLFVFLFVFELMCTDVCFDFTDDNTGSKHFFLEFQTYIHSTSEYNIFHDELCYEEIWLIFANEMWIISARSEYHNALCNNLCVFLCFKKRLHIAFINKMKWWQNKNRNMIFICNIRLDIYWK